MTHSNETIKRGQVSTINKDREQIINKLRTCESKLNSPEIQNKFERETDISKKRKFLDERNDLTALRVKLETANLEKIAQRLKSLEEDLNKGIEGLTKAINSVENTVVILNTIKNVTGLIARIIVIF